MNLSKILIVFLFFSQILFCEEMDSELREQRVDLYLESLSRQNKQEKLNGVLLKEIKQESRLKRLEKFGDLASQSGLIITSEKAFKKIVTLYPEQYQFLRKLGIVSVRLGHFSKAVVYLERFHEKTLGDVTSHFYHAEVLNWLKRYDEGQEHFEKAESLLEGQDEPEISEKVLLPNIKNRLYFYENALKTMEEIYKENSDDPFILIQYIDLLLFNDLVDDARQVYDDYKSRGIKISDKETTLLIELLEPRLLHENLQSPKALELTEGFIKRNPQSSESLSLKAGIMNNLYHWRIEKEAIHKLVELRPDDEDVIRRERNLWWHHSSFVDLEFYLRESDEGDQQLVSTLHAEKRFSDLRSMGLVSRLNFAKIPKSYNEDGVIENRHGSEWINELYFREEYIDGDSLKLSLYIPPDGGDLGGGITHRLSLDNGTFESHILYRQPYWDLTEGLLLGQVRDRIGFDRTWFLSNKLKVSLGLGYNRYGLEHAYKTGETTSIDTEVSYRLSPARWQNTIFGHASTLFLSYIIDKENCFSKEDRRNILGNYYFPINHEDREVHTVNVLLFKDINLKNDFETYIGYSYDRKSGDHGPGGGWLWRYRVQEDFEFRCFGSYGLTNTFFATIGVGVRWVF